MVLNEKQQRDIPNKQNKTAINNHIQHAHTHTTHEVSDLHREKTVHI